jgi:hypothetical protein
MEDKTTRQQKTNNYKRAVTYLNTKTCDKIKLEAKNNSQSMSQVLAEIIEGHYGAK